MPGMKNPDTRRKPMSPPAKSMQGKRNNAGPRSPMSTKQVNKPGHGKASAASQKVMGKKEGR